MSRTIHETSDYDKFEPHKFNRDTNPKRLSESMKAYGFHWQNAIACVKTTTGKFKIMQGHNRFEAAKAMGLPIFYTVGDPEKTPPVHALEPSNKPWNTRDYVTAFKRSGDDNCKEVLAYCDKTGIALTCAISMFAGESASSGNKVADVKRGTYQVTNRTLPRRVASVIQFMQESGVDWAIKAHMVKAVCLCIMLDEFDDDRFKHKVKTFPYLFEPVPTVDACLKMCEQVYNRMNSEKVPLAFNAKQAAGARAAVKYSGR